MSTTRRRIPELRELGPRAHGLRLSLDEFERLAPADGWRAELIEGVVEVSPSPNPHHGDLADAVYNALREATDAAGEPLFARVRHDPRVFVVDDPASATTPQPDVAAYLSYPRRPVMTYRGVDPALIVEIVSAGSEEKDYVRNAVLYARLASVLEYGIIDPLNDPMRPTMTVLRRSAGVAAFERVDVAPGGDYECAAWPALRVSLASLAAEGDE